jgi:hypothetical protein
MDDALYVGVNPPAQCSTGDNTGDGTRGRADEGSGTLGTSKLVSGPPESDSKGMVQSHAVFAHLLTLFLG